MTRPQRYVKKHVKAITRRRLNAKERHEHQQKQAQRDIEALRQALDDLGVPADLVTEIAGRLRAQKKLLGKIFALMFPTLFGCSNADELTRTRGWDKNLPSRILGALPKRAWLKRLRKLGQDVLGALWRHIEAMRAATRSRWQWPWVLDDSVFRKYSRTLELVGTWWSGQHKREDAYYGHLVLRLMACFVLYYTTRMIFQGQVTMDEIVFNLKHHWSSVDCQELELYGIS